MLKLARGVLAHDISKEQMFMLHAFLIVVFSDIPAISMLMRMKGHNGILPCRMCKILAIRNPSEKVHYVPHNRTGFPATMGTADLRESFDPANLPLQTHQEFMKLAAEVEAAQTQPTKAERLAKACGIKGLPCLAVLDSLSFPLSFPYDFMHLIWENVLKNLVLLWTGEFKGLDSGKEDYQFSKEVWKAIGKATAESGAYIPSAYGSRVPDIANEKSNVSAEMWSFWTLYLGPVLLRRQFRDEKYFDHFVQLVRLLHICLQFEITREKIQELRTGFIKWVKTYEEYESPDSEAYDIN
ncbi:hypothetical protein PQX77_013537 [Marasmius sp. AFHP31]|nr:hypothetical protein PQX77_013537 [Marasmius sp. AFHP31]